MNVPSQIANRYLLEEQIGQGGMGIVFRGHDSLTDQPVAIKVLKSDVIKSNPAILERFLREAEALRQLNHPNIITIHQMVEEDNQHYLVMEYIPGGSLRDLIESIPQIPLEQVLNITLDLADALTRAHRLDIIHRDIKPENILIAEDGTPRLTDFGLARIGGRSRVTEARNVIGTFAYLPRFGPK
jgi:serine/threonine protein kinase